VPAAEEGRLRRPDSAGGAGSWKTATTGTLTSGSGYTLTAKPPARGRLPYRADKRADADHTSAASPNLTLTVR
jgi:hypothetical protein